MRDPLAWAGRNGRLFLVAGLGAGLALPGLASALKPALPWLVAWLVFVSAMRIGARAALGSLSEARGSFSVALVLQLALPLVLAGGFALAGWLDHPAALAVVLAYSAPSSSGAPAFCAMMGRDPAPAMRLLVAGTALFPLTILPVFALLPALDSPGEVAVAALLLVVVLALAIGAAFALRRRFFPSPGVEAVQRLDGLAAVTLGVIVVGLMSGLGPAMDSAAAALPGWLALALAVNFGAQVIAHLVACARGTAADPSAALGVIAGNRNIALFLVALPPEIIDEVLIFIGCYQIPMYLTPIVMQRLHGRT